MRQRNTLWAAPFIVALAFGTLGMAFLFGVERLGYGAIPLGWALCTVGSYAGIAAFASNRICHWAPPPRRSEEVKGVFWLFVFAPGALAFGGSILAFFAFDHFINRKLYASWRLPTPA